MPQPVSRAQAIAAFLSSAGLEPRVTRHPGHIRVEADMPEAPTSSTWRSLLAALERGDRFGLDTDAVGSTAWALVFSASCGRTAPQGRGHQP